MIFFNETKPWIAVNDCNFIAAQFSTINHLCSKQLLFSAISNSTTVKFHLKVQFESLPQSHDVTRKCGTDQ